MACIKRLEFLYISSKDGEICFPFFLLQEFFLEVLDISLQFLDIFGLNGKCQVWAASNLWSLWFCCCWCFCCELWGCGGYCCYLLLYFYHWGWRGCLFVYCAWIAVARRTSVFDDPTMEIQELTAVIKQDITALNSAVVDLQLLCNSRNESGNISSDTTSHSTTVVDDLKNRLMSTTKEFKEVLTMRTEVILNTGFIFLISVSLVIWLGECCIPVVPLPLLFLKCLPYQLIVLYCSSEEFEGSWEQKTIVFFYSF